MIEVNERTIGVEIISLLLCFFVFTALFGVLLDLYKKRRIFRFSRDLQVFRFFPITGNALNFIGANVFTIIQKLLKKHRLPVTVWFGHECHYMTADADEIKVILNHPKADEKSHIYESFRIVFGSWLLLERHEEWKINRKLFQKAFSQQRHKSFVETFYQKSCDLVEAINIYPSKNKSELFNRYTLGSFCVNATGFANQENDVDLTKILHRLATTFGKRIVSSQLFPDFLWKYTQESKTLFEDLKGVRSFVNKIIGKKKQQLVDKELQKDSKHSYLLNLMVENEYKLFSEEDIYYQMLGFMLAGTNTTSLTLAYTLTLLGMNPKVQEKVYQEVKDTIGLENPICHSDMPKLKYTERAIFESMRLLPVVPMLGRSTAADVDLGTRVLPAGINIVVNIFELHRSEKYWKDPLKYDPDRFLPEEVGKRPPYSFLPFSGGPRTCIGMKYSIMAAKTAVANIIRNYEITSNYKSVEEIQLESAIILSPTHDLDYEFIPRKY